MIRFKNTRTGREVAAKDGRDLAAMVKLEQDRRSGLEVAAQAVASSMPALEQARKGCGPCDGPAGAHAVAS